MGKPAPPGRAAVTRRRSVETANEAMSAAGVGQLNGEIQ